MKLFLKILFVIFTVFVTTVEEAKPSTVVNISHGEISVSYFQEVESIYFDFENHSELFCKNGEYVVAYSERGKGENGSAAKKGVKYSEDLVKAAQELYPKKAGKIKLHHPTPQYLGGAKDQKLVAIDGAYHQQITNAFRNEWKYGLKEKPDDAELRIIMNKVYSQFPLPQ